MSMFLIKDTESLKYNRLGYEIDEIDLHKTNGYTQIDELETLGVKPLGRIYFDEYANLDYTTGEPVEKAVISGGEIGVLKKYLKAGEKVYSSEQVKDLINARIYEKNECLKPKLPEDVYAFLKELSNNKAKDKPVRALELMSKYKMIDYKEDTPHD